MRIEFVTDTFYPDVNGVAMTLGKLTDGLKVRGHYVHVIHTGEEYSAGQSVQKAVQFPGYKEVRVGLPCPLKLRKRWKKKRPDVIYVATESPLGVSALKAANELGIPVAAGFHTNFHQYLNRYSLRHMEKPAMGYLKYVHGMADMTVAPSADCVEMLGQYGFKNVQLVGRGVDVEQFSPSKRCSELRRDLGALDDTSPIAIIVGRVAAEKNLPFALDVVESMRQRNEKLQAVVVGDGPVKESLAEKHRNVHFVGVRQGEELAKYYASADILLFPSETETFGNVLLEGMASGLVTVSYDYAAASNFVEHGKNGLKAPLGDEVKFRELAEMALVMAEDRGIRHQAESSVRGQSWDKVIALFEQHFTTIVTARPVNQRRLTSRKKLKVRSLILSDIHLGTPDSKAREVVEVMKHIECEFLYLNGDIIDGWALKRGAKWKKSHTKVMRVFLKKMESERTKVVYLRGNHDDFLDRILPFTIGGLEIIKEHIHISATGKKYLVVHGDGFDSVSTRFKWIAGLGAVCYDFLLGVNRFYNWFRKLRGKEYFSLSKYMKSKVKSAVSFVDNYEEQLQALAKVKKCDGIICGHIHTPANKEINGVHYLNSGDWVETLSCIVEYEDGEFEVLYYEDILKRLEGSDQPELEKTQGASQIQGATESQGAESGDVAVA